MRPIDADALIKWINEARCADCPDKQEDRCAACQWDDAIISIETAPTVGGWVSADKRPPKQGLYLVWGLTRITPDHYDEANGFWEIQLALWFEKSGWDRKVKFWQMLPEPPKETSGDERG